MDYDCFKMKFHSTLAHIVSILFLVFAHQAFSRDLEIEQDGKVQKMSPQVLLKTSQKIEFSKDPTYKRVQNFEVKPLRDLFKGHVPSENSSILFEALDGFRVSIPAKLLFYTAGIEPLLAIENPSRPWAKIKQKGASAGPYYLLWRGEELAGKVGQEEWPFMVSKIIVQKSIEEEYPALVPKNVKIDSRVYRGFQVFAKNCFACHALGGAGGEKMGPDLNVPHSPTEYLKKEYFIKLVRNPQSLRSWAASQMSSFSEAAISNDDVDNLWRYLEHLKQQRP